VTQFVANVGLLLAALALTLANYWYTFGLWPRSWKSFVLCGVAGIILMAIREKVWKEQHSKTDCAK
jgi:hypothetical protein